MRALTVEELEFVSGGFGGLTSIDSTIDCFGGRKPKARPKRKRQPKPPAPCRAKRTYQSAGDDCAAGFSRDVASVEVTINANGEVEGGLKGFTKGLLGAGGSIRATVERVYCRPTSQPGCQPEGYDIFDLDAGGLAEFDLEIDLDGFDLSSC